jgi:hypothetical protein
MKITEPVPSYVTTTKVLEWEQESPRPEGMHLVATFADACSNRANWLLFFLWCYSKTNGFKDPCCRDWDYGKLGAKYERSIDGARDAFSEFAKFDDTDLMENSEEVEALYADACSWCESEVHKPVPEPQKPVPVPIPVPQPEPTPVPVPVPACGGTGFDWKAILRLVLPFLKAAVLVLGIGLPGWVKILLDIVVRSAENLLS